MSARRFTAAGATHDVPHGLLALVLAACGGSGGTATTFDAPEALSARTVQQRSAVVLMAGGAGSVRLLAPDTYALLAEVAGDAVWAGRGAWQESVVRVANADPRRIVLTRVDGSDELVVTSPSGATWTFAFVECGATLCSLTWRAPDDHQLVDVVDMRTLDKVTSYAREVPVTEGAVDPVREVVYHPDHEFRVVAEDQRTGKVVWAGALERSALRELSLDEVRLEVTARGRYVLSLQGWHRGAFEGAFLGVYETSTGKLVDVDRDRFRTLTRADVWIDPVPGTDDILVSRFAPGKGATRRTSLTAFEQITIPALATVSRRELPEADRWRAHAPRQVVPLATGRILVAEH